MRFLIIPDSFKNCLSSKEVGSNIAKGIKHVFPDAEIKITPIADGGEGTVEALVYALKGKIINTKVHDALMRPMDSFFGVSGDGNTAIIEMAAASGIEAIKKEERNPLLTTTFGTGELIKEALDLGCNHIIVGLGGSATNDGGTGMARALGAKFLNGNNHDVDLGGGSIDQIVSIDLSSMDKRLKDTKIQIACDVKNPLYGPEGASAVYGPQKGATPEMVQTLDSNLRHLANCLTKIGIDVTSLEGGGAAGGLGAGLFAFTKGTLERGFKIIAETLNLDSQIKQSDIIITAEGAVDFQTLFGKTPAGVASIAKKYKKPVFVFAGNALDDIEGLNTIGITSLVPITRKPILLEDALKNADNWLKISAIELCNTLKAGINLK